MCVCVCACVCGVCVEGDRECTLSACVLVWYSVDLECTLLKLVSVVCGLGGHTGVSQYRCVLVCGVLYTVVLME